MNETREVSCWSLSGTIGTVSAVVHRLTSDSVGYQHSSHNRDEEFCISSVGSMTGVGSRLGT